MRWGCVLVPVLLAGVPACKQPDRPAVRGAGDSLLAAGESLYVGEEYDSARTVWSSALQVAGTAHDERSEARALTSLAQAGRKLGDLETARRHGEAALVLKQRLGMSAELSKSFNSLGLIALDQGRNADAAGLFTRAIETARSAHDASAVAKASGNLGNAALYLGDMRRARESDRIQREAARGLGDARTEGNALNNEAMVDIWEGDPRPAIARLDTARGLYRRAGGYAAGEQKALSQLATAFELTGEIDRAFSALDTAIAIARRLGLRNEEAEDLRLLAGLHQGVGDYRRAVSYFEQAEMRMRSTGFEAERANALRGSAGAHLRLGNVRRASANAEQALHLHTAGGERLDQLDDLLLLAEIDFRLAGLARAEPRLRAGLALADQLDTRGTRIAVAIAEAHLADLARNPRRVLRALAGAAPDMAAGDFGSEWEANALSARAWARLGALDSAVATGRRAVAAVGRLRGALASEAIRATYVADRADVYSDLVLVLLRLGRSEEAFAVADAARSQELLRLLSTARGDIRTGAVTGQLLEGEELLRRIDAMVQRLRESARGRGRERGDESDPSDAQIAARLAAARGEYEALLIRAAQQQPRASTLLGADSTRLDSVRAALDGDEVLLDYLLTSDRVLIFAVTRDSMRVVQADFDAGALTQRVRLLRDLWGSASHDWKWGLGAARALHHTLLAPLRDAGVLRGKTRLVVVPHGVLGQVPFAALVDEGTGRYVMEDFSVTMLPSAAALPVLRHGLDPSAGWPNAAEGLAPFPDELPATRQEIAAFHGSLPRSTVRLGKQATEAELRRALAAIGLVHVATHGILNVRNPMFSRIELARPATARAGDDGRLEVHELLALSIRSPLVFLSGCETGAGQQWTDDPVRGAAELTFAQAMLSAGAANVVLTLWRIDDAGAAAFAARFYEALPRLSVAEALVRAQRAMARDAAYASPYYWAGYMLSGAGRLDGRAQTGAAASVSMYRSASSPSSAVSRRTP